uniref:hypothetical protein n=1 Tax=Candidatus Ichthyocystis hellenicum TaxID=1561003 RepID=UPI0011127D1C
MNVSRYNHEAGYAVPESAPTTGMPGPSKRKKSQRASQRASLELVTQHNCDNSPVMSIISVRAENSETRSSSSVTTVIKLEVAPKNHMVPSEKSMYLIIAKSPKSLIAANTHRGKLPSAEIRSLMTCPHGRSPSVSLIGATNVGLTTSIK